MVQRGKSPIVDSTEARRVRVGRGAATIGFAEEAIGHAGKSIVLDGNVVGMPTERQGRQFPEMPPAGARTGCVHPVSGRYFEVASPGMRCGGTDIEDPPLRERISPAASLANRLMSADVWLPGRDVVGRASAPATILSDLSRRDGVIETRPGPCVAACKLAQDHVERNVHSG